MSSQLADLSVPIPDRYVSQVGPRNDDYVPHGVIVEFLVGKLGRVPDQTIVREIYDQGTLTGCVLRLSTVIDGTEVTVEEAGDVEGTTGTNASRLKVAVSDAYKRCAMRMGLGLSLWVGPGYFLHESLSRREQESGNG